MGGDKEQGKSASDRVPLILAVFVPNIVAVLGLVGNLGTAVISQWDKLFPQKPSNQASSKSNELIPSSTAFGAHSPRLFAIMLKAKGPLFIVVPPDAEGASIGAHIANELQGKAFGLPVAVMVQNCLLRSKRPT